MTAFYAKLVGIFLWMIVCALALLVLSPLRLVGFCTNSAFARVFAWGGGLMARVKVDIDGREHLSGTRPAIFVANHQSALDLITFGPVYPRGAAVIGKIELLWIPVFNVLFWAGGNVFLNRQKTRDAIARLSNAVRAVRERRKSIWIFPEGTRNIDGSTLLPFKKGAFHLAIESGAPILPMVCSSVNHAVDTGQKRFEGGRVRVRILEPETTEGLGKDDVDALSERTRARMMACLHELNEELGLHG